MATSQTIPQSEGAETSVKSTSSLDPLSIKIVFKCHINRACILWKSILLGKVDVNDRIIKMLSKSTEGFISMFQNDGVSIELRNKLLIPCANSLSFLNLSTDLIAKITQGKSSSLILCNWISEILFAIIIIIRIARLPMLSFL